MDNGNSAKESKSNTRNNKKEIMNMFDGLNSMFNKH